MQLLCRSTIMANFVGRLIFQLILSFSLIFPVFAQEGINSRTISPIGRIWDVREARFIPTSQLLWTASKMRFILLGETHGRKAHQEREAFFLAALTEMNVYPDVFLEMVSSDQTPLVEQYRQQEPEYARGVAGVLNWAESNWPDWSYYEPVFNVAFMAKMAIFGADIPDQEQQKISSLTENIKPYEPEVLESWRSSMKKAHCNLIDDERLSSITQLQILRDQAMANAMNSDRRADIPALLIAGSAHTRRDRGIPRYLDADAVISIALLEISQDQPMEEVFPKPIFKDAIVYDYIWFTPKIEKTSLCDRLKK